MSDSKKRSHEETGNTMSHKPAQKKAREIESTQEELPIRRSLGFLERLIPAQKVIGLMNQYVYVAVYLLKLV